MFTREIQRAESLKERNCFSSATRIYVEALAQYPQHTTHIGFNLGAMYHMQLGNGDAARLNYHRAFESNSDYPDVEPPAVLNEILACICENMILLSLSYDEFYTWAERLREKSPDHKILVEILPMTKKAEESALPWKECLFSMSNLFWRPGNQNPARYGPAAAIFQILIKNRKSLRIDRRSYGIAIRNYAKMIAFIWENSLGRIGDSNINYSEITFILSDALPLMSEYINVVPDDEYVIDLINKFNDILSKSNINSQSEHLPEIKEDIVCSESCKTSIDVHSSKQTSNHAERITKNL